MAKVNEGPELDLAVAEACKMNATIYYNHELSKNVCLLLPSDEAFNPSSDLNDAFLAAEATGLFTVERDGPEVHLAKTIDGQWEVLTGGSEMGYIAREATPALAICAAILKNADIPNAHYHQPRKVVFDLKQTPAVIALNRTVIG